MYPDTALLADQKLFSGFFSLLEASLVSLFSLIYASNLYFSLCDILSKHRVTKGKDLQGYETNTVKTNCFSPYTHAHFLLGSPVKSCPPWSHFGHLTLANSELHTANTVTEKVLLVHHSFML